MLPYMCAYLIVEGTSSFSLMVDYDDGEKRGDLDCVSHGYRSPSVILSLWWDFSPVSDHSQGEHKCIESIQEE